MKPVALAGVLLLMFAGSVALGVVVFADNDASEPEGAVHTSVALDVERDPDVPELPFDDNPDPSQCGIPVRWGDEGQAWLTGMWEGELIQPEVLLYNSHLRTSVTGGAPHGTEVEIVLFQQNPVLNYYLVSVPGDPAQEGWVPAPFLSFEPVA